MQKIKNHRCGFISSQNRKGQAESDTKKKKLSFRSIPTRHGIGNSKNIAKICKKLRNIIVASIQGKTGWYRLRVIQKKKKSSHSDSFPPDPDKGIPKK